MRPLKARDGILHETRFVQRVGVDGDLHVVFFGDGKGVVDGGGRRAPVLVQLEADGAGLDLLAQRRGRRGISLAEKAEIHGKGLGGFEHAVHVPRAGACRWWRWCPWPGPCRRRSSW